MKHTGDRPMLIVFTSPIR